eukprot:TRINITY_DN16203_c0_g1_i2.p1 TRINITY_DN16203_c0_g1~~TRINITY_DN16203_c0_g1_i2.p1  ORF type:complete len:171 (-),score=29.99 TRINITY_DN16203_c0_g1_i2:311-823(-)
MPSLTLPVLVCAAFLLIGAQAQPGVSEKSKEVQCHLCRAVVNQTMKRLQPMVSAGTKFPVSQSIEDPCDVSNFRTYDYAPPTMIKACGIFFDEHDSSEVLEDTLNRAVRKAKNAGSTQLDREAIEQEICYQLTGVCVGVDFEKASKAAPQVTIDGVPQSVSPDGTLEPEL